MTITKKAIRKSKKIEPTKRKPTKAETRKALALSNIAAMRSDPESVWEVMRGQYRGSHLIDHDDGYAHVIRASDPDDLRDDLCVTWGANGVGEMNCALTPLHAADVEKLPYKRELNWEDGR